MNKTRQNDRLGKIALDFVLFKEYIAWRLSKLGLIYSNLTWKNKVKWKWIDTFHLSQLFICHYLSKFCTKLGPVKICTKYKQNEIRELVLSVYTQTVFGHELAAHNVQYLKMPLPIEPWWWPLLKLGYRLGIFLRIIPFDAKKKKVV